MKDMLFVTGLIIALFVLMPGCDNSPSEDSGDPKHTVTYDVNAPAGEIPSGTAPVDSTDYEQGDAVKVKGNTGNLAVTNYLFYDWNTSADGSGTTYFPGDVFVIDSEYVTLYAEWCDAAQWAQTVTAGIDSSRFNSVAVDGSGNIYAAGYIEGTGTYNFGNGKTATGEYWGGNIVLVKYDPTGTAQWAQTVTEGPGYSGFTSVAVDSSGNIYAAGYIGSTETYNFGNGKTAKGASLYGTVVLVKYDSTGTAQWVQTVTVTVDFVGSVFTSVAADSSGNVYAAGYIGSTGIYNFGNGKTATGTSFDYNAVLIKYNSSGTALWAQTVTAGIDSSRFKSVAVDNRGNVYVVGNIEGTGTYNFGNGKTAAGTSDYGNVVHIKYNSSGIAQWAQTVTEGPGNSEFYSVAVDSRGNIYAAGYVGGTGTYDFGNGKTATGSGSIVLVKYNSAGTAQWAQPVTVTESPGYSGFNSVAVDSSGNVYAAGYIAGTGTYNFGNGKTAAGTNDFIHLVLVKYNSDGMAQWAQTDKDGPSYSGFNSVAVDRSGNIYTAGYIYGTGTYNFENGITATGTADEYDEYNAVLVKY